MTGEITYPCRFWITIDATNVSTKVRGLSSAAIARSGMRASQLPTRGISSPKATITESGTAKGTPITISETYVSAPTIAITMTFARRYPPIRSQVDEDREDVARKRRGPLARPVEDPVSEPRQLFLERWQRRKVGPKLGVCLTDPRVALGVLRCAVGELDNLAEQRGHDDPADAYDESEAHDVDQHRRQPERQA